MGFGSYDESEQQDQDVSTDEDQGVSVHSADHDGELQFDTEEESTADLVDRLAEMREDDDQD